MPRTKTICLIGCAFNLCIAEGADAAETAERDLFQVGWLADETTDGFERREWLFTYRNHRRDMSWPWEESKAKDFDWGVDLRRNTGSSGDDGFEAHRFAGMLGKRFSPGLYAEVWLGNHRLDAPSRDASITTYEATVRLTAGDALDVRVQTGRDYLYREAFLPAGVTDLLAGRTHSVGLLWRPQPRLRAVGNVERRSLDDGNTGRRYAFSLLYGISPDWPWIWIGVGGEWLGYDEQRAGYWSPDDFRSVGVRLQAAFPLSERIEADASVNVDQLDESDIGTGDGQYLEAGLTYSLTPTLRLRLNAQRVNSLQAGDRWSETIYLLSLAGALL
ncbi:MAG TPA: hypothetical protein VJ011_08185 [Steroidobacteraceae bacterium]|nr:hypothetical protein [Steroidobacteraceae bacterium]